MKHFVLFFILIAIAINGYSQSTKKSVCDSTLIYITKQLEDIDFRINGMNRFKLYPTENIYTLLSHRTNFTSLNLTSTIYRVC